MNSDLMPSEQPLDVDLVKEFKYLALRVSEFASEAETPVIPYHDPNLLLFRQADQNHKLAINAGLRSIVDICEACVAEGVHLKDQPQFLWMALTRLSLRPTSDFFSHLQSEDIVEIHGPAGQIFRNFNYYRYCSYSLEELSSIHWTKLYDRNRDLENQLVGMTKQVIDRKCTIFADQEKHIVKETSSAFSFKLSYKLRLMAPLFHREKSRATDHLTVVLRAELLERSLVAQSQYAVL